MRLRFLLSIAIGLLSPFAAFAATASLSAPAEVQVGHTFQVKLNVSGATDVDTVRFIGSYPTDLLQYQGAANVSSLPTRSPGSSAGSGSFNFGGFSLGNPVNGSFQAGVLTFKALQTGMATISLGSGTRILSAGADQLSGMGSVKVNIVAAPPPGTIPVTPPAETTVTLSSDSHPDPNSWYASRNVSVSWNITGQTPIETTIGFDQAPEGPAETKKASDGSTTFLATADGVWYAHLVVRFSSTDIVRKDLRIQIDTTPPHEFAVVADYTDVISDIPNVLRFAAIDDESGVARYDVSMNGNFLASTTDTALTLGRLPPGDYNVDVRATDFAGNSAEAKSSFRILSKVQAPFVPYAESTRDVVVRWISILLICLLLFVLGWFVGRLMANKKAKRRTRK
jgi:hypothetical protein